MEINMCYLYPELLNLYGDTGNGTILKHRMAQRGIMVNIYNHTLGDEFKKDLYDIVLLGGGQDFEMSIVSDDIKKTLVQDLKDYIENDGILLAICGGYQMLGEYYVMPNGQKIEGLGILPIFTDNGEGRLIGNIAVKIGDFTCVGFENHAGRTNIGDLKPLGEVIKGYGNGCDNGEGVRYKNTFCTYLHGPFLSKNPEIADMIIKLALEKKYGDVTLTPLDDEYELSAKKAILKKLEISYK